jgi:Septum formation
MSTTFRIPGTTGPEINVGRSLLGSVQVLVDGRKAERKKLKGLVYDIHMPDGTSKELRLTGQWTGFTAVVDGQEVEIERKLRPWEVVLTFLPLILAALGGLVGALFAIGGAAINARIARAGLRPPIRAAGMVGVTLVTAGLFFGTLVLIAPLPRLAVGTCVNGVHEGATLTMAVTRPVDCAGPHENEVIGSVDYTSSTGFPGDAALLPFASTNCLAVFASYVGISFQESSLDMIPIVPTQVSWAKGDRTVVCVVLATDRGSLTGSVSGTAK